MVLAIIELYGLSLDHKGAKQGGAELCQAHAKHGKLASKLDYWSLTTTELVEISFSTENQCLAI